MRYLPQTKHDREKMLAEIGVANVDTLYQNVPEAAQDGVTFDLPDHQGEIEVEKHLSALAQKNHPAPEGPFFLGAGCYYHHVPATVDHIIQRSEFLTAYTPYQPEISQGTLTAVFEFQTMLCQLTGMDVANASMYDGATAMAEAALMALRIRKKCSRIAVDSNIHPHYMETLHSYVQNYEEVEVIPAEDADEKTACIITQIPDFHGNIKSLEALRAQCDEKNALLVVITNEILSLGLLPAPVEADIVAGEAQSVGVPMSFGGPHLGFFAAKEKYLRQMPGRICGETVDEDGKRSFCLTLNTREQHIRREKATSNICTNQGLFATAFTIHMSLLGEIGFKHLAQLNHEKACELYDALSEVKGVEPLNETFFNEFAVRVKNAQAIIDKLAQKNIIAGYAAAEDILLVTATEMTSSDDISLFVNALSEEVTG